MSSNATFDGESIPSPFPVHLLEREELLWTVGTVGVMDAQPTLVVASLE
jgi:hypothetical protein